MKECVKRMPGLAIMGRAGYEHNTELGGGSQPIISTYGICSGFPNPDKNTHSITRSGAKPGICHSRFCVCQTKWPKAFGLKMKICVTFFQQGQKFIKCVGNSFRLD